MKGIILAGGSRNKTLSIDKGSIETDYAGI